jgi:hypothetical protein
MADRLSLGDLQAFRPAAWGCQLASLAATRKDAPELRSYGSYPAAPAAINGSSQQLLYCESTATGYSGATDRFTVIAAIENLRPAVGAIQPAAP